MFFAGRPLASRETKRADRKARRSDPAHACEAAKAKSDDHARAREACRPARESFETLRAMGQRTERTRRGRRRQARRANGGSGGRSFHVNSSERFRTGEVPTSSSGRHARRCSLLAVCTHTHTFAANAPHELLTKLSETRHAEGQRPKGRRPTRPHARAYSPTDSRLCPIAPSGVRLARTHTNRRRVHTDV
jgi:hypothetical protein